jgi:hypothetical protein
MAALKIENISQFNSFIDKIKDDLKEKVVEVDAEIGASCEEIATGAKRRATLDVVGNPIAQRIYVNKAADLSYTINSDNPYSAYFEFGTGKYAAAYLPLIDDEWRELARKYYINGKGTIPERKFMYPSFKEVFPKMINRIKNILNA